MVTATRSSSMARRRRVPRSARRVVQHIHAATHSRRDERVRLGLVRESSDEHERDLRARAKATPRAHNTWTLTMSARGNPKRVDARDGANEQRVADQLTAVRVGRQQEERAWSPLAALAATRAHAGGVAEIGGHVLKIARGARGIAREPDAFSTFVVCNGSPSSDGNKG